MQTIKIIKIHIAYILGFLCVPILFAMYIYSYQKNAFHSAWISIKHDTKQHKSIYKRHMKTLDLS